MHVRSCGAFLGGTWPVEPVFRFMAVPGPRHEGCAGDGCLSCLSGLVVFFEVASVAIWLKALGPPGPRAAACAVLSAPWRLSSDGFVLHAFVQRRIAALLIVVHFFQFHGR